MLGTYHALSEWYLVQEIFPGKPSLWILWVLLIPIPDLYIAQLLRNSSQVSWSEPADNFGGSSLTLCVDCMARAGTWAGATGAG